MRQVVVLGRGGAGKSVLARRIREVSGLPVTELDELFWSADLRATPRPRWEDTQRALTIAETWVLDGDLGPYDSLQHRLAAADTVIILDFGVARCAWRALRKSRERADFWRCLLGWRRHRRMETIAAVQRWAPGAGLHLLSTPRQVDEFLATTATSAGQG